MRPLLKLDNSAPMKKLLKIEDGVENDDVLEVVILTTATLFSFFSFFTIIMVTKNRITVCPLTRKD